MQTTIDLHLPRYGYRFWPHATYYDAHGGRASSKTWTIARIIIAKCAVKPIWVIVCREQQNAIDLSAKRALETAIHDMGLDDHFEIRSTFIRSRSGAVIQFRGVERNREQIRGWEGVDIVWNEEAHQMSEATMGVMIPTVTRNTDVELYFSWNPHNRHDWAYRRFITAPREGDVSEQVNWYNNPWFPKGSEIERQECLRMCPEDYEHVWEGLPIEEGRERKVLPYDLVEICVEAFRQGHHKDLPDFIEGGLDIADAGNDFNALAIRNGPTLLHVEKWLGKRKPEDGSEWIHDDMGYTSELVHKRANEYGVQRLYYDTGGVGAPIRGYFGKKQDRRYVLRPELFGGRVKGGKTTYSYRYTNEMQFSNRSAQMAWALRLRAQNTRRLMAGDDVDRYRCLFISTEIEGLPELMSQLSQPSWRENEASGKTEMRKRDENERSPDLYDAAIMAFGRDSENGLSLRS